MRLLRPPLSDLLAVLALTMWAGTRFLAHDVVPVWAAGGGLTLLGLAIVLAGVVSFRRAGTTIDPVHIERAEKLVTTGVFGLTRNPMYLGFAAMLCGWSLLLGSLWTLSGPFLFVLYIQRFQISPEERMMRAKFGADYDIYTKHVRRWI